MPTKSARPIKRFSFVEVPYGKLLLAAAFIVFLFFALLLMQKIPGILGAEDSQRLLSRSKLGVYIFDWSPGGEQILLAGPRVVNVYNAHEKSKDKLRELLRRYKQLYPQGILICHCGEKNNVNFRFTVSDNPEKSAADYWKFVVEPALNKMTEADRKLFDYITATNEYDNTPILKGTKEAEWTGKFWIALTKEMQKTGYKVNVGEVPVGNWEITDNESIMPPLAQALRVVKAAGGIWSYHAFTLKTSTDPGVEVWYALRYRQFYTWLKDKYPDLADMPMALTEAGIDDIGDPKASGWQVRSNEEEYKKWLVFFDKELQRDPYILGATIYQIGDTYWSSSNIEPIARWLAEYIDANPRPKVTAVPTPDPISPTPPQTDSSAALSLLRSAFVWTSTVIKNVIYSFF